MNTFNPNETIESAKINENFEGLADSTFMADGVAVQMVRSITTTYATGTTLIPFDDTIPQNTEGTEFMTLAITPKSATNLLRIEATINASYSVAAWLMSALFQDSTANALAVSVDYLATATGMGVMKIDYTKVAGTTSATTFKVRAGGQTAGTLYLNSNTNSRKWGGIGQSSMVITEYKAS